MIAYQRTLEFTGPGGEMRNVVSTSLNALGAAALAALVSAIVPSVVPAQDSKPETKATSPPVRPDVIVPPLQRRRPEPGKLSTRIKPQKNQPPSPGTAAKKKGRGKAAAAKPAGAGFQCAAGFQYDAKALRCVAGGTGKAPSGAPGSAPSQLESAKVRQR